MKTIGAWPTSPLAQRWDAVFRDPDPWHYDDSYERAKRAHLLEMVPQTPLSSALELGCAEGHVTAHLAAVVASLVAVDISSVALARAGIRCRYLPNVAFKQHDIFRSLPSEAFDLIVCSEILSYAKNRASLDRLARRIVKRLKRGGYLLIAHANVVADDKNSTGFDFHEIGAHFIGERFQRLPQLELTRELRTDLYRVQLFRTTPNVPARRPPDVTLRAAQFGPRDRVTSLIKWGGCDVTDAEARHLWCSNEIPILMYHRIADDGPAGLASYRLASERFQQQLSYLRRQGYRSVSLQEAVAALSDVRRSPKGRLVVLTFDDAYKDFHDRAWPLIRHYGFTATVFVPTSYVGSKAEWDRSHGDPAQLMSWDELRDLHRQGLSIGSHTITHRHLGNLAAGDVELELQGSRETLEKELGELTDLIAYPFNSADDSVGRVAQMCGYRYGVLGAGLLRHGANALKLPRQEVLGHHTLEDFTTLLGAAHRASLSDRLRYRWWRTRRDRRTYTAF